MPSDKKTRSAADFLPEQLGLPSLRDAAVDCRGCELYRRGTQTVFGAGNRSARVMFVGEQPGNEEDLKGEPFVGPAGRLLDHALVAAGIDRNQAYVTNMVKHFKWVPRGKKRIHQKPRAGEIAACRPWLLAEIAVVKPRAIVCLGATAAQALLGRTFLVSKQSGQVIRGTGLAELMLATVHPSSILRAPDDETRHRELQRFIDDLKAISEETHARPSP